MHGTSAARKLYYSHLLDLNSTRLKRTDLWHTSILGVFLGNTQNFDAGKSRLLIFMARQTRALLAVNTSGLGWVMGSAGTCDTHAELAPLCDELEKQQRRGMLATLPRFPWVQSQLMTIRKVFFAWSHKIFRLTARSKLEADDVDWLQWLWLSEFIQAQSHWCMGIIPCESRYLRPGERELELELENFIFQGL